MPNFHDVLCKMRGMGINMEKHDSTKRTYESIIDSIKSDIIKGKLSSGDRLPPERDLAKQFGVSRTSIREALRTLEILGVIESIQGSGNFIAGNYTKSLTESMSMMFLLQQFNSLQVSELREALETKAALLAVDNITDEQIKRLEEIVNEMSVTIDENKNVALDKELHYTIAAASKNSIIMQILNILEELISIYIKDRRKEILSDKNNVTRLQNIHEKMVSGLKYRDSKATHEAIMQHFGIISEYIRHN